MKKCLLFGSNGYIGTHLAYYLRKQGYYVTCFDIQRTSNDANYQMIDVSDVTELERLDYDVDFIFWFSGLTGTLDSFMKADSFLHVNELGLINLLHLLKDMTVRPRIVFPSTRLVYKGQEHMLSEEAVLEPKTVYAINKLSCEYYLESFGRLFGIPYTIYRICVPYGNMLSNNYSYGTVGFFIEKALKGDNITLYGDGKLRRTFTHIYDLCHQIIYSCNKDKALNRILNIGGENLSLFEAASMIAQHYGVSIEFAEWPLQASILESGSTFFDDSAMLQIIGNYSYKRIAEQTWE